MCSRLSQSRGHCHPGEEFRRPIALRRSLPKRGTGEVTLVLSTISRLAARRSHAAHDEVPVSSYARVVFAWEGGPPSDLRPALLVDFELGTQGSGVPHTEDAIFDASFHKSVRYVADALVGQRRFHQLRHQLPSGVEFAPGTLTGTSGGLAILLSQLLANRPADRRAHTLVRTTSLGSGNGVARRACGWTSPFCWCY